MRISTQKLTYLEKAANLKIRTIYLLKITFCFTMGVDLKTKVEISHRKGEKWTKNP